jgi:hypothetical protein
VMLFILFVIVYCLIFSGNKLFSHPLDKVVR